jgi:hypothetical protein
MYKFCFLQSKMILVIYSLRPLEGELIVAKKHLRFDKSYPMIYSISE